MASANVKEFTDDNFDAEVLKSDTPVLVDFWAEWCAPCRALGPTIDKLADDYDGKVKVGKLNVDNHKKTSVNYRINSIPTLLLVKNGEVQETFIGMAQEGDLKAAIDKHL